MTEIDITIKERYVEELIEMKQDELSRVENVLNSYRSNSLTTFGGHYDRLLEDKEALALEIESLQNKLDESASKEERNELEELFSN